MSIDWISVKTRVPGDERMVMVWGKQRGHASQFRQSHYDGEAFDCDHEYKDSYYTTTHWAEIEGPTPCDDTFQNWHSFEDVPSQPALLKRLLGIHLWRCSRCGTTREGWVIPMSKTVGEGG